jgi:uncharacterized RDD family membrane protein YckC
MIGDSVREELKDKITIIKKPKILEQRSFASEFKLSAPATFEARATTEAEPPRIPKPEKPLFAPVMEKPLITSPEIFLEAPTAETPLIARAAENPLVPKIETPLITTMQQKPLAAATEKPVMAAKPERTETMPIGVKPTVPTLVEFKTEKATLPEWRLHLQNAVQQRQSRAEPETQAPARLVTNGATALKTERKEEPAPVYHENPTVNSALRRIEQSRRRFLSEPFPVEQPVFTEEPAAKTYPYHIATKDGETLPAPEVKPRPAKVNVTLKPKAATTLKADTKEFDTNKLPKIPAKVAARFEKEEFEDEEELKLAETEEIFDEDEYEEIEDLAPFSMRFNSGLFDLIIGAFLSFVLLIPFMIKSESWFNASGLIAFAGTCAVVMFIYLTTSVALYGRTFGMRIFALEVVDIEGEDYPTIHQAAVSSCVYIFSLALGGIGFVTLPFSADRRAVHDLISGTIVVREI